MKNIFIYLTCGLVQLMACKDDDSSVTNTDDVVSEITAAITSVTVSGEENQYTFNVGIKSPDLGCNQYADWWEVISEEGTLIYRRILAHSHVNEQPFTRSGGPVSITNDQVVYVRVHMNNMGYGGAFGGSVLQGFESFDLEDNFASDLETTAPLPNGCAF